MTTKISQIAAHYLEEQTRLIIPEVGTLLRRKESGEIVLVPMLKKSDGVLASLVAEQLEVGADEAARLVATYSEAILDSLAKNKKFILDGIGVLLINPKGALEFAFNPLSRTIPAATESLYEEAPKTFEPVEPEQPQEVVAEEPEQPRVVVAEEPEQPRVVEVVVEPKAKSPQVEPEQASEQPEPMAKENAAPVKPEEQSKFAKLSWDISSKLGLGKGAKEQDEEQEAKKPKSRIQTHLKRKKIDFVTVVAILAVILAIISLVWGLTPNKMELDVDALGGSDEVIEFVE